MNKARDSRTETRQEPVAKTKKAKRQYEKPAFQHEKVFETMALACGKLAGATQAQCHFNRKLS
jgi:hypothetical protein